MAETAQDAAPTMAELIRARADDPNPALVFSEEHVGAAGSSDGPAEGAGVGVITYADWVDGCAARAAYLADHRTSGPPHVGVLLDNVAEFPLWLGAAAVSGATIVGINPTRQGAELARDITHTDCQLIVTDSSYRAILDGLDLGAARDRVLTVDADDYEPQLAPYFGADLPSIEVGPDDIFLLLFTSGTSGAPKACLCSQGRLGRIAALAGQMFALSAESVCYLAMPLFHSNALMAGWGPAVAVGATTALRPKFSASGFLPDVRRYGVTFFNYVGKPLAYILATSEASDDDDNTLKLVFGNEAAEHDTARFGARFGCTVIDGYGSTEGSAVIMRTPDTPPGSLGVADEHTKVLDPETTEECPPAAFDDDGALTNADACIGEIVNTKGADSFEGYYNNDEANAARARGSEYWTGDLGYRDADRFFYFAGRDYEWLRVDGENFAAAPVERILGRHPGVSECAVYAVPDTDVGDQAMAAVVMHTDAPFDPAGFAEFLAAQTDLGTKWAPRYVRVADSLPATRTNKVLKRGLRRERWQCADPVWWRPGKAIRYRLLTDEDREEIHACFVNRDRLAVLET